MSVHLSAWNKEDRTALIFVNLLLGFFLLKCIYMRSIPIFVHIRYKLMHLNEELFTFRTYRRDWPL